MLVITAALIVAIASGAWIAHFTPLPVAAAAGALWGALAGLALGYALVHDFHHSRTVRVRRH